MTLYESSCWKMRGLKAMQKMLLFLFLQALPMQAVQTVKN